MPTFENAKYDSPDNTHIQADRGAKTVTIPATTANRDYRLLIEEATVVAPYVRPPTVPKEIELEANRRHDLILTKREQRKAFQSMIKWILNFGVDINVWPAEKKAAGLAWNDAFNAMDLVDDAADVLLASPPIDPTDDIHWP